MKTRWIAAVLGIALTPPLVAQAAEPVPASQAAAKISPASSVATQPSVVPAAPIELTLAPFFGLLRTVTGRIGEVEGPFLFDTGGGATILSLKTVKALGIAPFGRITGFRHDGERLDAERGGPVDLTLGAFRRHGEVGVIDLDRLFGSPTPLAGIIALETFEGQAITVDLAKNRLIVESPRSLAQRIQGARELKVRFVRQAGGATLDLYVAIEGKHGPLWFELDCGALSTVLVAPHAFAELGLEPPAAGQTRKADLKVLGLGPVPVEITAKEMIFDGLLNAELFTRYVITLDLDRARAWVTPNP
jgi:hypothetical protein